MTASSYTRTEKEMEAVKQSSVQRRRSEPKSERQRWRIERGCSGKHLPASFEDKIKACHVFHCTLNNTSASMRWLWVHAPQLLKKTDKNTQNTIKNIQGFDNARKVFKWNNTSRYRNALKIQKDIMWSVSVTAWVTDSHALTVSVTF